MKPLPCHRYQFKCRLQAPLTLNDYAGSMLRGAFGHALRKTACMTGMDNCKNCLLYRQCAYPRIFETPPPSQSHFQQFSQIPNAFVIEPPPMGQQKLPAGEYFNFNMVLLGRAIADLPIVVLAWQAALKAGLGADHAKAELLEVIFEPGQTIAHSLYSVSKPQLLPAPIFQPEPIPACRQIQLQLLTPLRIQQQGRVLSDTLSGKDFLMALVRRYYLLQEFHSANYQAPDFAALAAQAASIEVNHHFKWCVWQRYSQRQKQQMTFGGVLGKLELSGDLSVFLPLLLIGQWLHVGNKTTFGMGGYTILST